MLLKFSMTYEEIQENILYLIEIGLDPADFIRNVEHDLGWECSNCGWKVTKPRSADCLECNEENTVKPLWICSSCEWTPTLVVEGKCRNCRGLVKEYWIRKSLAPPRCPAENPGPAR